jgi:hypothetical protein
MPIDPTSLDAEEYLDRYGVTAYMKDVVTLLLENRPASPIAFISKYFRTVTQGSSPLLRAYRYIRLAHPTQDAFIDNLVAAYAALDARRGVSGVTGAELLRLLRLLCGDCPIDVSRSVLVLIDRAESDPITFDEFSGAVRAGLHYDDLFKRARTLFDTCDPLHTGTIPRTTLQLVIRQVRSTDADAGAIAAVAAASASSSGGSSSGGSSSAAGTSAATRVGGHAELHRLQREVQCEVAFRLGLAQGASATPSPIEVGYRLSAAVAGTGASIGVDAVLSSGASGGGASSNSASSVELDEFLEAVFVATLTGHEAASAALQVAKPQNTSAPDGLGSGPSASASSALAPESPGRCPGRSGSANLLHRAALARSYES